LGPCCVIGEFVAFFDGEIVAPVGDFKVSFEMVNVGYWRGIFKVDCNRF